MHRNRIELPAARRCALGFKWPVRETTALIALQSVAAAMLSAFAVAGCGASSAAGLPGGSAAGSGESAAGGATGGGATGGGTAEGSSGHGTTAGGTNAKGGANAAGGNSTNGAAGEAISEGHGQVVLARRSGSPNLVQLSPTFGNGPAGDCPAISSYGSCSFLKCEDTDPATVRVLSAGTVSAASLPVGMQLVAAPDLQLASGYPQVRQSLMGDFKSGEVIVVSATGAEVPPFSDELKMFAPLLLTKPTSTAASIPISRQGVDLEWESGEAGTTVTLVAFGGSPDWTELFCSWDATSGAGSVPAEALKPLANATALSIVVRRDAVHHAGNFAIKLALISTAQRAADPRPLQLVLDDALQSPAPKPSRSPTRACRARRRALRAGMGSRRR